jgi:tetratricopeptide (TPR) repeat protein
MPRIFISYRREDSLPYAGRLFDGLAARFGDDQVFMDIDTIQPGDDFLAVIERKVDSCDALLAVIGNQWAKSIDARGRRRIDNPDDYVRLEIATALRRRVRVIPVLVQGAPMPGPDELPPPLQRLARHNALEIDNKRWRVDVARLVQALERPADAAAAPDYASPPSFGPSAMNGGSNDGDRSSALLEGRSPTRRGPTTPLDRPQTARRNAIRVLTVLALVSVVGAGVVLTDRADWLDRWTGLGSILLPRTEGPTETPAAIATADPSNKAAEAPTIVVSLPTATPVPTTEPTVAAMATAVPPTATAGPGERLQVARAALTERDFPRAIGLLEELGRTDPAMPGLDMALYDAHLGHGRALLDRGDLDGSYAEYGRALVLKPGEVDALEGQKQVVLAKNWGRMEAVWGSDDEEAIRALEEIMTLDLAYRDARQKLYALLIGKADRLLIVGDRDAAFSVLVRALEVEPDGMEARQRLQTYTPAPTPAQKPIMPPPPAPTPTPAQEPIVPRPLPPAPPPAGPAPAQKPIMPPPPAPTPTPAQEPIVPRPLPPAPPPAGPTPAEKPIVPLQPQPQPQPKPIVPQQPALAPAPTQKPIVPPQPKPIVPLQPQPTQKPIVPPQPQPTPKPIVPQQPQPTPRPL